MILTFHKIVVFLFLLIYVIKTILLLSDKKDLLSNFTKKIKIFEIIVSALFLITGIYLLTQSSFGGKYDSLLWIKLIMVFASIPVAIVGFKKGNKVLAALSLLMIVGSYGLAEVYHGKKAKAEKTNIGLTEGKTLFENNCVKCHGNDGKLGANGAKDLSASTMDVAEIKQIILNGKGLMPQAQVNDEQAAAIAEYVTGNLKGH